MRIEKRKLGQAKTKDRCVNENTINTIDEIPTSGLVAIEFETKSWKNLPKGTVIKTLFAKEL